MLNPEWLQWWRENLRVMKDGGIHCQVRRGVAFRKDPGRVMTIIWQSPQYPATDTAKYNRRCLEALGYKVRLGILSTEEFRKALDGIGPAIMDEASRQFIQSL